MNTEQVIKLIDAGFTKEEILQMQSASAPPVADPPTSPPEVPAAEAPKPEPDKGEKPLQPFDGNGFIEQMQQTMNKFISDLQAVNLSSASLPEVNTKPEDLLAKLINPPGLKDKKGE